MSSVGVVHRGKLEVANTLVLENLCTGFERLCKHEAGIQSFLEYSGVHLLLVVLIVFFLLLGSESVLFMDQGVFMLLIVFLFLDFIALHIIFHLGHVVLKVKLLVLNVVETVLIKIKVFLLEIILYFLFKDLLLILFTFFNQVLDSNIC